MPKMLDLIRDRRSPVAGSPTPLQWRIPLKGDAP